jgi:hypothetical protein
MQSMDNTNENKFLTFSNKKKNMMARTVQAPMTFTVVGTVVSDIEAEYIEIKPHKPFHTI